MSRVIDRLEHLEMNLRAARDLRDRVRGRPFVLRVAAARRGFLRIAALALDDPAGRLDKFEMGAPDGGRDDDSSSNSDGKTTIHENLQSSDSMSRADQNRQRSAA